MQKIVLRYGFYASLLMVAFFTLSWSIFGATNFEVQEVFGYVGIVLGLIFVYFGIKRYRDGVNSGILTFGQGLKVGLLIVLIPSILIALLDMVYVNILNPEFMDTYFEYLIEKTERTTSPDRLESALQTLDAQREMFSNPFMIGLVMFFTVFFIGVIVAVASVFILQRKPVKESEQ